MWVLCPTLTFKAEQDIWKGSEWEKCTKRMVSRNKKYEENIGKNALNVWFSGAGKMRNFIFYMSIWPRQRRVLYRTLTFKKKENIMVIATTQKDVVQQDFEPGIPSIENSCLQAANNK
jgi:hypothetical protein